ncbi:MAG: hypothetical protein GX801_01965 [Fibrobacter sp.]|nr:hypothetical protein [Fibrobacter sp.]
MELLEKFSSTLFYTLSETAPYVLMGYAIAAFIREFLPRDFLARWLGPKGLGPLLKAVGIGAVLPVCSCGVIPLGVGLVKCGASRGTVLSFMTSSPAISPVSLILGISLLGPVFMAYYVGIVLVGSFILGFVGNKVLPQGKVYRENQKGFQHRDEDLTEEERKKPLWTRIKRAFNWGFFDLGAEISLDLLFGLTLATAVSVLVPPNWIASWLGGAGILSIIFVIILTIPIYTCSVPSIPVVQRLLMLGASPGVGIAYFLAGPATNLGELSVIRRSMGLKTMFFYMGSLILMALAGGMLVNYVMLDGEGVKMIGHTARHLSSQLMGMAKWEDVWSYLLEEGLYLQISTVLVIAILAVGSFKKIRLLITDPCQHCMFWNDVSNSASCPGRCWLKKTQLTLTKPFRKK